MHPSTPNRPRLRWSRRLRDGCMPVCIRALHSSVLLPLLCLLQLTAVLSAQPAQLRIVVIQGQDALNNTQAAANANVVVEIRGADQMPIPGVAVTFVYPMQGASGTFANGTRQMTVNTGADGRATASGVRPVGGTGTLQIRVTASYLGRTATAVFPQTNVAALVQDPRPTAAAPQTAPPASAQTTIPRVSAPHKTGMRKSTKILIIVAIAAGAAVGAVVATRSGGSSSPSSSGTPPIVLTPGTPTVGGPQ
ncbi:MAG: hypothetical protein ABI824_08755 [Acidobacteriota bacterium]